MSNTEYQIQQQRDTQKLRELIETVTKKVNTWVDSLPEKTPTVVKNKIEETISPLSELNNNVGTDKCRIYLFGRTGSAKSSIMNAIAGTYVAEVGVGKPQTQEIKEFRMDSCNAIFYDTRGLEKDSLAVDEKGYKQILKQMKRESPDIILLCIKRSQLRDEGSGIEQLIQGTEEMVEEIKKINSRSLPIPIVVALTRVDEDQKLTRKQRYDMHSGLRSVRRAVIDKMKEDTLELWNNRKNSSKILQNTTLVAPVYTGDQSTEEDVFGIENEVDNLVALINGSQQDLTKIIWSRRKSMFEQATRTIADKIITTASAINAILLAPTLPIAGLIIAGNQIIAGKIIDKMLETLALLSYDKKRTYETYIEEHQGAVTSAKAFQVVSSFAIGSVGAGSTAFLGAHARDYFLSEEENASTSNA